MSGATVELAGVVTALRRADGGPVLDGVDLAAAAGSCHGIVGESGSGKTTLARVLLGRLALAGGTARVDGIDVPPAPARRTDLARRVAHVPQDAAGALDPRLPVWRAIAEGPLVHGLVRGRGAARDLAAGLLAEVGLPSSVLDRLPAELSGGQAQRVCLARAVACGPSLLVADEPTSALDPVAALHVLDLMDALRRASGATLVLVSHGLGAVRRLCDTVTVVHRGRTVESGPVARVLSCPAHPHTRELLGAEAQDVGRRASGG